MKSMCQEARRNSPSVADRRPTSSCIRTASAMASSSTARSSAAVIRPAGEVVAGPSSRGGRSRLPTWSARNGGLVLRDIANLSFIGAGYEPARSSMLLPTGGVAPGRRRPAGRLAPGAPRRERVSAWCSLFISASTSVKWAPRSTGGRSPARSDTSTVRRISSLMNEAVTPRCPPPPRPGRRRRPGRARTGGAGAPGTRVRPGDLDGQVDPAWPVGEGRLQDVGPVGGQHERDVCVLADAVHRFEQGEQQRVAVRLKSRRCRRDRRPRAPPSTAAAAGPGRRPAR